MQSFKDILHSREGKTAFFHWQLLSFFALEPDEQIGRIGPCKDWFIKEFPNTNPGANYLKTMVALFIDYGCAGHFDTWAPAEAVEIARVATDMFCNSSKSVWTCDAVRNGEEWHQLRLFAQEILRQCALDPNPQLEPYDFPQLMEIWWDGHKSLKR